MINAYEAIRRLRELSEPHDRGAVICALAGMASKDIATALPEDIFSGWSPPEAYDYGKALTRDQARELLALAESKRDHAILYLAVVVGLRQVEIRRLVWSDVHPGTNLIRVTGKGGKRRTVPVGTEVEDLFPERTDANVFTSYRGGPISESGMRLIIDGYLERVAPDATPHALRHTALTWLLEQGADIKTAMELAGHSTVSSHEIYAATSSSWIVREWHDRHPLGGIPVVTIRVPGKQFRGKMARGVERAVLIPEWAREEVEAALTYFTSTKQLTNRARKLGLRFRDIRDAGAVALTENNAHPFLIAMLVGTTPSNVVRRSFDRMTEGAIKGRQEAIAQLGYEFTQGVARA